MYRIFCESLENYRKDFDWDDVRFGISEPLVLIGDVDQFDLARQKNTREYQMLCDLLYYASQNIDRYRSLKAFLWTLESRGITPKYFGVSDNAILEEQIKLINSFLRLAYWE